MFQSYNSVSCSQHSISQLKQNKSWGMAQRTSASLAYTGALGSMSSTTKWGKKSHINKNVKMQLFGTFSHFILFQSIWKQAA